MNRLSFMAILAAVTLLGTMSSAAAGVMRNVNCDKGQSIQKALDTSTGYGGVIEVVITGFCEENITAGGAQLAFNETRDVSLMRKVAHLYDLRLLEDCASDDDVADSPA